MDLVCASRFIDKSFPAGRCNEMSFFVWRKSLALHSSVKDLVRESTSGSHDCCFFNVPQVHLVERP